MKSKLIPFFFFLTFFTIVLHNHNFAKVKNYVEYARTILTKENDNDETILKTIFSPEKEPHPKKVLLGLIENEKKSIQLAQFLINDKEIAEALCKAHDRGIKISIITDRGSSNYPNEKITKLKEKGIEVLVYKRIHSSMHNKFYIFEQNFFDKPIVWMGSANATFSAFGKNQESIMIFNDSCNVQAYKTKYVLLRNEILQPKNNYLEKELSYKIFTKSQNKHFSGIAKIIRIIRK